MDSLVLEGLKARALKIVRSSRDPARSMQLMRARAASLLDSNSRGIIFKEQSVEGALDADSWRGTRGPLSTPGHDSGASHVLVKVSLNGVKLEVIPQPDRRFGLEMRASPYKKFVYQRCTVRGRETKAVCNLFPCRHGDGTSTDDPKVVALSAAIDICLAFDRVLVRAARRRGKRPWLCFDAQLFPSLQFETAEMIFKGVVVTKYKRLAVSSTDEWFSKYSKLLGKVAVGIKRSDEEPGNYELRYERGPHYCFRCGFIGHDDTECDKKRMGMPKKGYDDRLRCSPLRKFAQRSASIPPLPGFMHSSDMVPSMRGLGSLVVPFGSVDAAMSDADSVLGKRAAEQNRNENVEMEGDIIAISQASAGDGGKAKKGKVRGFQADKGGEQGDMEKDAGIDTEATSLGAAGKLTGPNVVPRQEQ